MKYYYWRTRTIWHDINRHWQDLEDYLASPQNKIDMINYQFKMWNNFKEPDEKSWGNLLDLTNSLGIEVLAVFNVFKNNGGDYHFPGLHVIMFMNKEEETLFLLGLDQRIDGFEHRGANPLTRIEQEFAIKVN